MDNKKLYSYLMTHDSGFAPNPFHGTLTLATCMADIRRTKAVGDWVAGFASKALVKKCAALGITIPHQGMIYLMEIGEILRLDAYFKDPRFQLKKAILPGTTNTIMERGDNIYFSDDNGSYVQLENDNHDAGEFIKDTGGKNALIARQFYYFGRNCPVPSNFWSSLGVRVPDRYIGFGCESEAFAVEQTIAYLLEQGFQPESHGLPCIWD